MPRLRDALGWLLPARDNVPSPRETKASATARVVSWGTLGQPVWSPRDYQTFAHEGFMQNPIVYRSVRMIAEAAATIPLLLYEGANEIESHPLLDLMARPSLDHTGTDFLEAWYGYLLVSGNAYAEAVAVGGALREIHALRPDRMKVLPGADGWPEGYEYTAAGGSVRLMGEAAEHVRRVLHVRLFHPTNDHYGMSPIEAAAVAIDTHNTAAQWNKALLDNAARPSGALVYASRDGHLTDEQFGRLKAELEAGFQGARNAGRPMLLEGGLDWKPLSLSPKDMDFVEAKNAAAREIALALGVPPMLLGIPGDNTYSNYQEASRSLWRQTVLPLVNRTAKALSGWLGPAYGGGLELRPDLDQIEALAGEREALWARLGKAEFLTDDEKRAAVGYGRKREGDGPVGPAEGGLASGKAGQPKGQGIRAKFNHHHDELGRFTTADGAGGSADPFADTLPAIVVGQGDGDAEAESAVGGNSPYDGELLHEVADRGGRRVGLLEEEAGGGHTIVQHVGKNPEYLLERVRSSRVRGMFVSVGLKRAGSFPSVEAAEKLVNSTLSSHMVIVESVATGRLDSATLMSQFLSPTGIEAYARNDKEVPRMRDTFGVTVVLRHDPSLPNGFRVVTAYPSNHD